MSSNNMICKVTVITVCRNAEVSIGETVRNVIQQSYSNVEYIIVDGGSTDRTLDIIKKYADEYPIKYISEPDSGVYNAMNKGIRLCTGDYVVFINAGDGFWEKDTVRKVVEFMEANRGDIFYGNCVRTNKGLVRESRHNYGTLRYMLEGKQPYHQCTFARSKIFKKISFDETYRVRSDFDWFLRCKKAGYKFCYMDFIISRYARFGYSARSKQKRTYASETERSIRKHYPKLFFFYKLSLLK